MTIAEQIVEQMRPATERARGALAGLRLAMLVVGSECEKTAERLRKAKGLTGGRA